MPTLYTPYVIERSSRGERSYDVFSRLLMDRLEAEALALGARWLVLDTNESLEAAQHLYRTSGYQDVPPYNENPNATHWFAKRLG